MSTTTFTKGIEEYEENVTFGTGITGTGLVHSFGTRKIQTFVGSLADTDTSTQYADGDVLVELGALDTSSPSSIVTPSKFFIHRALIGITTAAGQTLVGGLSLSATSGTATNSAVSSGTEIVGAGVTSFNEQLSATQSITEIDINFNDTAGNYHIFVPNVTAAIARRFTVELEYSVF
jgi:hypothetical protein